MPLNVRRFFTSIFLFLIAIVGVATGQAPPATQATTAQSNPLTAVEKQPTAAEIMRDRISKAKAFIAVRNYNAAIYELENIRRESGDQSVNAVANVLLMNSYLEQGDHKRAQTFLNEFFKSYKSNSAAGNMYYASIAAQVIKGARNQVERYRSLGLNVSDRNLPLEAVNDVERMRETLELVIAQAKELGADKSKVGAALALLEEATNSRSMIARDDYDARRWHQELGDSRELLANSRSVIISAVDGTAVANAAPQDTTVATNLPAATTSNPVQQNTVAPSGPNTTTASPVQQNISAPNVPAATISDPQPQVAKAQDAVAKPVDNQVASNTTSAPPVSVASNNEPLRPRVAENKPVDDNRQKVQPLRPNVRTDEPKEKEKEKVLRPNVRTEETKDKPQPLRPNVRTETPKEDATDKESKQKVQPLRPNVRTETSEAPKQDTPGQSQPAPQTAASNSDAASPLDVGSLISYATKQQAPIYPPAAKTLRTSGVVKVEVTVDESGDVAEVHTMTGPGMLQAAAKDAIRKWKFKPFTRDGQPVKAMGFVNFNFSL